MRYAGNYRLMDNPRAKHSHQLRALEKRRDRLAKVASYQRTTSKGGEVTR